MRCVRFACLLWLLPVLPAVAAPKANSLTHCAAVSAISAHLSHVSRMGDAATRFRNAEVIFTAAAGRLAKLEGEGADVTAEIRELRQSLGATVREPSDAGDIIDHYQKHCAPVLDTATRLQRLPE
jgi:hypothetical protein